MAINDGEIYCPKKHRKVVFAEKCPKCGDFIGFDRRSDTFGCDFEARKEQGG